MRDDTEVMRDEENAHAHLHLLGADEIENLRLGRDVESRGRLVGNQNGGAAAQRHRDHGALTHAAAELIGILARDLCRTRHAYGSERVDNGGCAGVRAVQAHRLLNLEADGVLRAERRHRLLKDHGDLFPANPAAVAVPVASMLSRCSACPDSLK